MQVQLQLDNIQIENPLYLEKDLITYIGNKRGLLPFIGQGVNLVKSKLNKEKLTFLDFLIHENAR